MSLNVVDQIMSGSKKAAKTYAYNEQDARHPAQWWFQNAPVGLVLFVVFYTQACRWNRCLGCNLPSMCALHPIHYRDIIAQVDHLFSLPEIKEQAHEIHKIILSNNGSILDEVTFPSTALFYLLARLNVELSNMEVLSLETRVEYVDWDEIAYIARALNERDVRAELELAIGFEAFDDHIRNHLFHKGLNLSGFEKLLAMIAPYGYRLKCYFMQKPVVGMSDDEAVADIHAAIDYLHEQAGRYNVKLNMHLNPTYVARGTVLAEAFERGQYTPPSLRDVARAARHARGRNLSIFLGLYDEGLAVPGGSFIREREEELVARLEAFNRTQDFDLLEGI